MKAGRLISGRYRLGEQLAAGGTSQVFRAEDELLGELVAVKMLHPVLNGSAHQRERFAREIKTMRALVHPNIVQITDAGATKQGVPYMVQEFIDAPLLHDVFGGMSLDSDVYLPIVLQIASALEFCHGRDIVHRDLKPTNVFVLKSEDGQNHVKITDFGIAKLMEEPAITLNGMMAGTPGYMAPEYIRGDDLTAQVDIYSLGVILYELTTGLHPFPDSTADGLMRAHASILPESPRESRPSLDLRLTQFILRCLEKLPENRPPGATGFLAELRSLTGAVS